MKDIIISVKRQKTEIRLFCVCLLIAVALNVYSIISYNTEWSELWTQFWWVLVIGCGLYGLTVLFRLLVWGIKQAVAGGKTEKH